MKRLLVCSVLALTLFFSFSTPEVFAQGKEWSSGCLGQGGVPTLRCIPDLFSNLVNAALIFVGVVAVIMLIYGGIKFINSGGDQKQTSEARKILTFAILGVVLVLGSFFIINAIGWATDSTDCITDIDKVASGGC